MTAQIVDYEKFYECQESGAWVASMLKAIDNCDDAEVIAASARGAARSAYRAIGRLPFESADAFWDRVEGDAGRSEYSIDLRDVASAIKSDVMSVVEDKFAEMGSGIDDLAEKVADSIDVRPHVQDILDNYDFISRDYLDDYVTSDDLRRYAKESYVDDCVCGLASESYVDEAIKDFVKELRAAIGVISTLRNRQAVDAERINRLVYENERLSKRVEALDARLGIVLAGM